MSLRPNDYIISDANWHEHIDPVIDGERKARGLIPRNYETHPVGHYRSAPPLQIPLIPRNEWPERIKDGEASKSFISHVRRRAGPGGGQIPSLDQNSKGYCLPPGTPVRMADGAHKAIEQIQLGDMVLSYKMIPRRVLQLHRRLFTGNMVSIRADGLERPLTTTSDHVIPFRRTHPESLGWGECEACSWTAGAELYAFKGDVITNLKVRSVGKKPVVNLPVYDIGVEEDHYFFANDVLVHNCWGHSTTMAVILTRALMNQPYVRLSAFMVCCIIKSYVDEGGWGSLSLDFIQEHGIPSVEFWPEKSMSRSNDNDAMRANAKLHIVTDSWADMAAGQYDRNLSEDQAMTLLLSRVPVVGDFNFWGHSIALMDPVLATSSPGLLATDFDSLDLTNQNDLAVYAEAFGKRLINSWTDSYGDQGEAVLTGHKALMDGGVAPLVTIPSLV